MKKASTSFLILSFAALLVSTQSFAQRRPRPVPVPVPAPIPLPFPGQQYPHQDQVIEQRVTQTLRSYERLRLSDLLRLSSHEMHLQVRSLTLMAESLIHGSATLQVMHLGRPIASEIVRKNLRQVQVILPPMVRISELEFSSSADIFIDSISAEVDSRIQSPFPGQDLQVSPNQLIMLQVNQHVSGRTDLKLKQLVRQQHGLSLEGAEIERVIVQGDPSSYSRAIALVQVEINGRLVGPAKQLSFQTNRTPLPVNTSEEVRTLQLVVFGEAYIHTVAIKVGQVRPQFPQWPQYPHSQHVMVQRQIGPQRDLELSSVLGYDSRLIRSITLEAQSLRQLQAQVALIGDFSFQGAVTIQGQGVRARLHLDRPMAAHQLKLEASDPVMIQSLEIEYAR